MYGIIVREQRIERSEQATHDISHYIFVGRFTREGIFMFTL